MAAEDVGSDRAADTKDSNADPNDPNAPDADINAEGPGAIRGLASIA